MHTKGEGTPVARPPDRVHLRLLTSDDADWVVGVDVATADSTARPHGWHPEKLAAELDEGIWATEERCGWAVVADGENVGFATVTGMDSGDGTMQVRLGAEARGRGIGRQVLRQLADHHFASDPLLRRLVGRTHEANVPMQRSFNAAGFRMEARYRDTWTEVDGRRSSEWGYALTRDDFDARRHHTADRGYDLHGLAFEVIDVATEQPHIHSGVEYRFLQEGRRVIGRYDDGPETFEGELAGTLVGDTFTYAFVHEREDEDLAGFTTRTGTGVGRIQRRADGRLELVTNWSGTDGRSGSTVIVEVRGG